MTSMVEKVAKAIQHADAHKGTYYGVDDADAGTMARAAIEAMREPTDAMVDAMQDDIDWDGDAVRAYKCAIDAALNEQVSG